MNMYLEMKQKKGDEKRQILACSPDYLCFYILEI